MDTDEGAQPDIETPDCLRRQLAASIVAYHRGTSEAWWQHALNGGEGQCRGAGLLSNETHQELQPHMTKRAFAQLYASYHWQMGVLVSSLVSCMPSSVLGCCEFDSASDPALENSFS